MTVAPRASGPTVLPLPRLAVVFFAGFNLRTDPYEFADITSNSYYDRML
jgi:hypothetical protein